MDGEAQQCGWTYTVRLERCTNTICRLLGLFAQFDQNVLALSVDAGDVGHKLVLSGGDLDARRASLLAEKMAACVGVLDVDLTKTSAAA